MASLPSGYTKLDYIQSSGTQYINTGFTPKGNSRVVMDFENMLIPADAAALFGARTDTEKNVFGMWFDTTAVQPHYGNVTYNTKPIAVASYNVRQIYDLNKGVATVGGTSVTFNQLTFNSGCNLTLLAINTNGTVDERRASGKLYSAKIYDNGTLVRDFIPCKNASGTLGLWDNVNSVFYANAGTGTFSTGTKHKTLIDGTGYEIKSGRVLIAGTGYGVKKGRTLIGGTGYDIKFATPVGELEVGTSVYMNVNGVRKEWIAVHQGLPSSIYDSSCNGTWLLMKDIYTTLKLTTNGGDIGKYPQTNFSLYLNNQFFNLLDSDIRSIIPQVKIKYYQNSTLSTDNGLKDMYAKIFLLGAHEVNHTDQSTPVDGACLDYFKSTNEINSKRIAYLSGEPELWGLRTMSTITYSSRKYYYVLRSGNIGNLSTVDDTNVSVGMRPALILPQEALIDSDFNIIPA